MHIGKTRAVPAPSGSSIRCAGIEEIAPGSIAVAIYGSTVAGTFDEQSDIDILVIGDPFVASVLRNHVLVAGAAL
ncbi:nucleotidyltransferase domain-containing protein [Methanoculleus bourgensis]|uniref:Polymerase nucleotidyl transferase domain-containing protein n=1 Tax=Methanoculleus bourgensis TaxID=83986 RepID=A0A0X3BNR0_9EURY|nr:nucleotidyltransferase domain-containing protein [Methanoculleus bourgensis]CVK33766.1 conserved protein of unknown function [Methanoculleus bourgensis]